MKNDILKVTRRLKAQKNIDARKFMLFELLPLLQKMQANTDASFEVVEANFENVFETLGLNEDISFLEATRSLIQSFSLLVDNLCVDSGLFVKENNVLTPAKDASAERLKEIEAIGVQVANWYTMEAATLEALALDEATEDEATEDEATEDEATEDEATEDKAKND